MTTTIPTVTATLGDKLLVNASTFFGNNLRTIISELLQNSRRAGATEVNIQIPTSPDPTSHGTITFADNGSGIAVETFPTLLALGSSKWDDIIEGVESPAGMGLFSLAARNPVIETSGYKIVLNDAVFKGKENARILPGNVTKGTTITFEILKQDYENKHPSTNTTPETLSHYRQATLREVIEKESIHAPVQVLINNQPVMHVPFGEGAIASHDMLGTRIYIHRYTSRSKYCPVSGRPDTNFYGHPIRLPSNQAERLTIVDSAHYTSDTLPENLTRSSIAIETATYSIRIDILDTTHLKPKLPDRDSFHETSAINQIISHGRRMIYELISKNLFQKISPVPCRGTNTELARAEAASFGITLPPTYHNAMLYRAHASNPDYTCEKVFFSTENKTPENITIRTKAFLNRDLETGTIAPWIEHSNPLLFVSSNLAQTSSDIASTYDVTITDQNGTITTFADLIHNPFQDDNHYASVEQTNENLRDYISKRNTEIVTDITLTYRAHDGSQIGQPVSISYLPSINTDARSFEANDLEIIYTDKATAKGVATSLSDIVLVDDMRDYLNDTDISDPDDHVWEEVKKVAAKALNSSTANIDIALTEIQDKIADILANYQNTFRDQLASATITIKRTKQGYSTTSSFKTRKA